MTIVLPTSPEYCRYTTLCNAEFTVCVCVFLSVDVERYNCMLPVMNTMLEKCEHMLNTTAHLPSMPHSNDDPAYCDDFRIYLQSEEWKTFMKKQVSSKFFPVSCVFSFLAIS